MKRTIFAIVPLVLGLSACEDDEKKDDDSSPDDSPSAWLVGDDGEMLRLTAEGDAAGYPLDEDDDFNAITCVGHETAWVVGDVGTVLLSRDAGDSWDRVDVGIDSDLRGVAAADFDVGHEAVWAVGDGGVIVHSDDGGVTWERLSSPAIDWTAVATDATGSSTIAAASDGSLWRIVDDELAQIRDGDGDALASVSVSPNGRHAAAAGAHGLVLVSHDETSTWETVPAATTRGLHAVRISADGELVVAVGEAGVTVHVDGEGASAREHLSVDIALHGLHLRADGGGQAVGDGGTVLFTQDAGRSWSRVDVGTQSTLRGVDDFHFGHHL